MIGAKTGVYLCEGCGIGAALDVASLAGAAAAPLVRRHDCLCSDDGVAAIRDDLAGGGIDRAVIGACSRRVMSDRFRFDGAPVIRANLREQVAWTHPPDDPDTQAMAVDQLRMAVAEAASVALPEPMIEGPFSARILVVGGGVSGLTAAREASAAGQEVLLVERSGALGGWAREWSRRMPYRPPYRGLAENDVGALAAAVEADAAIEVRTRTTVAGTAGMPGKFAVRLRGPDGEATETVGAIVVATGWREYDPANLGHLGYGSSPDVVTGIELERMLAAGRLARPSDGRAPNYVAFLQCAGSRDPDHLPYCSSICCGVSIKQALQIVRADAQASVYVVYDELRTPGAMEEFYREAQEAGVIFLKGKVKSVDSALTVLVDDELLGQEVPLAGLDMVVLATGLVPNSTDLDAAAQDGAAAAPMPDIDPAAPLGAAGETAAPRRAGAPLAGGPVLNLQYRQGPHLPVLADGFADSHFLCFPYETRRSGIYACGPVRRPMGIAEAVDDAAGAALKAIQAIRNAGAGAALHPRVGDLSLPRFGLDTCTQCGRCSMECPFGAIEIGPDRYPAVAETRCRRCGVCMGACPVQTIGFDDYNVRMVSGMIASVEMPADEGAPPRILVLACENDAYPALDMAGIARRRYSASVRIVPVRCLGSVTMAWISDAFGHGFDGVMLMGCKSGDDYQCHFVKGSAVAEERMARMEETLTGLGFERSRIACEEVAIVDSGRVPGLIDEFAAAVGGLEPNPFKGLE